MKKCFLQLRRKFLFLRRNFLIVVKKKNYSCEEIFFIKAFMYSYKFFCLREKFFYRSIPERSACFVKKKLEKKC